MRPQTPLPMPREPRHRRRPLPQRAAGAALGRGQQRQIVDLADHIVQADGELR
jgi:hypothetical protein